MQDGTKSKGQASAASSTAPSTETEVLEASVEFVDDSELRELVQRPGFWAYLKSIWSRREYIWEDSRSRAFNSGEGTFLGKAWVVLNPIFQVLIYILVFGFILKTNRGIDNFVGFMVIGVIFFGFFSKGILAGNGLVQQSKGLVNSFSFPNAAAAVSSTLQSFFDNIVPAILAVIVSLCFQLDTWPSPTVLLVVPVFILAHFFMLACTLITARITAFVPDMKQIVTVVTRGLFFLSGVFFPLSRFDSHAMLKEIMMLNPIYQFLEVVRVLVLDGQLPSAFSMIYIVAITTVGLLLASIYFWTAEAKYAGVK